MTAEDKLRKYIIKTYGEIDYGKTKKNIKNISKYFKDVIKDRGRKRLPSKDI